MTAADVVLNYWPYVSETNNFWTQFRSFMLTTQLTQLGKSFIIFEIRDGFLDLWVDYDSGQLEDMFSTLKGQGCRIMFICGTEEARFYEYNDFLQYVDIHINTDLLTLYVDNALRTMEETFQEDYVSNCAILLNSDISSIIEKYFIPYFKYCSDNLDLFYPENQTPQAFLEWCSQFLGIEIFVGSGNSYTNQASGAAVSYEQILMEQSRLFALEAFWGMDEEFVYGQLDDLFDGQYVWQYFFPVFIYNASGTDLSEYSDSYNLYESDDGMSILLEDISDIVEAFLSGGSLTVYANWVGHCPFTYKPIRFSPDGWIRFCRYIPCWLLSIPD